MASIEDMDAQIEKAEKRVAQLKARKASAIAKRRTQEKKWMDSVHFEIGRMVIEALGCEWTQIDIAKLRAYLEDHAEKVSSAAVIAERTPEDAKDALDSYCGRGKYRKKAPDSGEDGESHEHEPEPESGEAVEAEAKPGFGFPFAGKQ